MSIVPDRGACVTMLMPPRMMYVSTPSGVVPSNVQVERLSAAAEDPRQPLGAGHDGHTGRLRLGRSSPLSAARSGNAGTVTAPSAPGSGSRSGGRSAGPGVRFGTWTSGAPSIGGKSMMGGCVPVGGTCCIAVRCTCGSVVRVAPLPSRGDGRHDHPCGAGPLHHRVALGLRLSGSSGRRGRWVRLHGARTQWRHRVVGLIAHNRLRRDDRHDFPGACAAAARASLRPPDQGLEVGIDRRRIAIPFPATLATAGGASSLEARSA